MSGAPSMFQNQGQDNDWKSRIIYPYACVTMVDVYEGDCYVVDLFQGGKELIDASKEAAELRAECNRPTKLVLKDLPVRSGSFGVGSLVDEDMNQRKKAAADATTKELKILRESTRNSHLWDRYIIDTGSHRDDEGIGGRGRQAALKRAFFRSNTVSSSPLECVLPWAPWNFDKQDIINPSNWPIFRGIIITHTDMDHWGNAESLIDWAKDIFRKSISPPTTVFLSPMFEWARALSDFLDPTKDVQSGSFPFESRNLFAVRTHWRLTGEGLPTPGLRIVIPPVQMTVCRTFTSLLEYTHQLGYDLLLRLNIAEDNYYIKPEYNDRPLHPKLITDHLPSKNTKWISLRNVLGEKFKSIAMTDKDIEIDIDFTGITDSKEVLTGAIKISYIVELALNPPDWRFQRTYDMEVGELNRTISGKWLREHAVVFPLPPKTPIDLAKLNNQPFSTPTEIIRITKSHYAKAFNINIDKIETESEANNTDPKIAGNEGRMILEGEEVEDKNKDDPTITNTSGATGFQPVYRCIGTTNKLEFFVSQSIARTARGQDDLERGEQTSNFGLSYMGCAGSAYVRDFQHIALQYALQQKPPSKSGQNKLPYPKKFAEYKNRASILTHFVCRTKPWEVPTITEIENGNHMLKNPNFSMLFTGDAFDKHNDEDPHPTHLRINKFKNPKSHVMGQDVDIDGDDGHMNPGRIQSAIGNPDGSISSWLWRRQLTSRVYVDVLKIPHHGSSHTTGPGFYRNVVAKVYLISGAIGIHGHPRSEIIEAIIHTILNEDGPAVAPKHYRRSANPKPDEVKGWKTKPITARPRPRLIFVTHFAVNTDSETKDEKPPGSDKDPKQNLKQSQLNFGGNTGGLPKGEQKNKKKTESEELQEKLKKEAELKELQEMSEKDAKLRKELKDRERAEDRPNWEHRAKKRPDTHGNSKRYFLKQYILEHCKWMADDPKYNDNYNAKRANCRIFYQANKDATTRLIFGHDAVRPNDLRVEWNPDDWKELRQFQSDPRFSGSPYKILNGRPFGLTNSEEDPVAYPQPFEDHPEWELP
ncbi:hypothetical protein TWF788_008162 [Orbilia oligospora]|uniref:Metallo-beta-lactamase domain-containing protein n=1 Tax=Orbilia oligospora TaxID=2813651 RepID=A0A7C8UAA0_ORBOL|nr:hypothetical protein TWF788_008162 [Orbilia oligospora]